jgi:ribose transport system substrate-binding protein
MRDARLGGSKLFVAVVLAVLFCLGILVSGCGGGDSSTGETADTSGDGASPEVKEYAKFVEEHEVEPASLSDELKPLSKPPPTGITYTGLGVGTPLSAIYGAGETAAATALGWKPKYMEEGATPDSVTSTWNELARAKPDAIGSLAIPTELFKNQLTQLVSEGTIHTTIAIPEGPGPDTIACVSCGPTYTERGAWVAKWIVADSGGNADALFFNVAEFPILKFSDEGFEKVMETCAGCKSKLIDVPASALGKSLPQQVVSEIQRDPDINYVSFGFGDMTLGVYQALNAAGLDEKVKILAANPSERNLAEIEEGTEVASVSEGQELIGWLAVDSVARKLVGDKLPQEAYANVPLQYITANNIDTVDVTKPLPGVAGYQQQFEKLWGVGG